MRKTAWIIIATTILLWLAIALYWTGTGTTKIQLPSPSSAIPLNEPPISSSPTPLVASPSSATDSANTGDQEPGLSY
jgi:hypothetical protein